MGDETTVHDLNHELLDEEDDEAEEDSEQTLDDEGEGRSGVAIGAALDEGCERDPVGCRKAV